LSTLQIIWFFLIGILLMGYAILDGFDLGVGFWHLFTRKDKDRRYFLKAIGPVWDGNEVWLLTGGGALFAAFPPVYASVFSGFYLALILVLFGLIFRAVGVEFRGKIDSPSWKNRWDIAFSIGSIIPALLFGVALGNIVRGIELDPSGNYIGGFLALLNPYALVVGLTGLAMFATHGALYLALKMEGELLEKVRGWAARAWLFYISLFLLSAAWSLAVYSRGALILPLIAAILALLSTIGIKVYNGKGADGKAFVASCLSIASLFGAVGATIFPNLVRSIKNPELSLSIYNSSSSSLTLMVMLILVIIGMPLVIGYTIYIYRTFSGKVRLFEEGY
jgi:cytochrome d ubiquinol oxidase subunit II